MPFEDARPLTEWPKAGAEQHSHVILHNAKARSMKFSIIRNRTHAFEKYDQLEVNLT
jgi:hypothetical protein